MDASRRYAVELLTLVFGYIHHFESNEFMIPDVVKRICYQFYAIPDYFSQIGGRMIINDRRTIIECDDVDGGDAFGKVLVQPEYNTIHRWIFKIISTCKSIDDDNDSEHEIFGIGLADEDEDRSFFYCSNGTMLQSLNWQHEQYGIKYKQGDIVTMSLDNYELRFKVNEQDQGIMLHYLPLGFYKMVVSLSGLLESPTTIELLSYSTEKSK